MARFSVAASGQWIDEDGVRQPAGEVHGWVPGTNQTACGLPLSRSRLIRFPHVPWEYGPTDVLTEADRVGAICPRCLAAAGGRRPGQRRWTRVNPRP
ncbi:hypothetical protein HC031_13660 [Planosporangium thailandense]|uniref:Uncharacterized protein n=1 Tax=Planosporangium thailandense TaxID=765197 RepID=A0ABX0XXH7_9ACTN|nr:hypothetical protein [Planosporangium thailandense]NJC70753.1 hypothetical protein [Planosporangium thailandense]